MHIIRNELAPRERALQPCAHGHVVTLVLPRPCDNRLIALIVFFGEQEAL